MLCSQARNYRRTVLMNGVDIHLKELKVKKAIEYSAEIIEL